VLVIISTLQNDESALWVEFSAAYLLFEVMRRTIFDPVFLVMFQPLTTHQRLKGHTLEVESVEGEGTTFIIKLPYI